MSYYLQHHCFPINIIRRKPSSQHSFASQNNNATSEQYHISPNHYTQEGTSISSISSSILRHHCFCSIEEITSWLYLSSFGKVLLTFAIVYISFVTIFASFLFLLNWYYENRLQRECMDGWDVLASGYVNYEATFSLSWTTFSSKFDLFVLLDFLFNEWILTTSI